MNKKAKLYLTISLVCVAVGLLMSILSKGTGMPPQVFVFLPVGAVFFGLFLVVAFLGNEAEQHTKEQDDFAKAADMEAGKH